jgi:hypothetical protein
MLGGNFGKQLQVTWACRNLGGPGNFNTMSLPIISKGLDRVLNRLRRLLRS